MKVRISYATPVEDLPEKFGMIIKQNVVPLRQTTKLLQSVVDILETDGFDSIQFINYALDKVRRNMASIDESLEEVSTLVSGYIKATVLNSPDPPLYPVEPDGSPITPEGE